MADECLIGFVGFVLANLAWLGDSAINLTESSPALFDDRNRLS